MHQLINIQLINSIGIFSDRVAGKDQFTKNCNNFQNHKIILTLYSPMPHAGILPINSDNQKSL